MSEQDVNENDKDKTARDASIDETSTPAAAKTTAGMTPLAKAVGIALVLLAIVLLIQLTSSEPADSQPEAVSAANSAEPQAALTAPVQNVAILDRDADTDVAGLGGIERRGEGRHFFTTIRVPANAESLYLSGSGASPLEDGSWGDMEQQVVDTFSSFQATLEGQGWSMGDIVQVRAFALSDEFGYLDFDGFNRGYRQFFGTEENPLKPVRTFVEIQDLVVPGWLVEIEIRAARLP